MTERVSCEEEEEEEEEEEGRQRDREMIGDEIRTERLQEVGKQKKGTQNWPVERRTEGKRREEGWGEGGKSDKVVCSQTREGLNEEINIWEF